MRPMSEIWQHWTPVTAHGKICVVECNYCSNKQRRNATKCQWHTLKCSGHVPEHFRTYLRESFQNNRKKIKAYRNVVSSGREKKETCDSVNLPINLRLPSFSRTEGLHVGSSPVSNVMRGDTHHLPVSTSGNEVSYYFEDEVQIPNDSSIPSSNAFSTCVGNPTISACSTNFISILSKKKYKRLSDLFGKAIFTSHVPFHFVENPFLKEFFKELSSGFVLPTKRELTENVLTSVYEDIHKENLKKIDKSKFVTVIVSHQTSLINVMLCIPEPIFYKAIETNEPKLTASAYADIICDVAQCVGVSKVCAFVSDNMLDLVSVQTIITDSFPHVLGVGSAAHILVTFVNNISRLQTVYQFLSNVKYIFSEFQKSKVKMKLFEKTWDSYVEEETRNDKSVTRCNLRVNSESKWPAVREMFDKLIDSKMVLQKLALNTEAELTLKTKMLLLNEEVFWHRLEDVQTLFRVLLDGIVRVEGEKAAISDATDVFKQVFCEFSHFLEGGNASQSRQSTTFLTASERKKIGIFLQNLIEQKPLSDAHIAAYMLDPRFSNDLLTMDEVSSGLHFMWNYVKSLGCATGAAKEELCDSWQSFDARTGIFDCEILFGSKKINPGKWWQSSVLLKNHHTLSTIASRLLSIPASSTVIDKNVQPRMHLDPKDRFTGLSEMQLQKLISVEMSVQLVNKELQENWLTSAKESLSVDDIVPLEDPYPVNSTGEVQLEEVQVYYLEEVETDYHEHDYSVQ